MCPDTSSERTTLILNEIVNTMDNERDQWLSIVNRLRSLTRERCPQLNYSIRSNEKPGGGRRYLTAEEHVVKKDDKRSGFSPESWIVDDEPNYKASPTIHARIYHPFTRRIIR